MRAMRASAPLAAALLAAAVAGVIGASARRSHPRGGGGRNGARAAGPAQARHGPSPAAPCAAATRRVSLRGVGDEIKRPITARGAADRRPAAPPRTRLPSCAGERGRRARAQKLIAAISRAPAPAALAGSPLAINLPLGGGERARRVSSPLRERGGAGGEPEGKEALRGSRRKKREGKSSWPVGAADAPLLVAHAAGRERGQADAETTSRCCVDWHARCCVSFLLVARETALAARAPCSPPQACAVPGSPKPTKPT